MTELFPNISAEARKQAELAWVLACTCKNPVDAAKMLDAYTNYECSRSKEEGLREFLNFYFNLKMEELKKDEDSTDIG